MTDRQPNIVFFFWDNFGWGELGCYGGGMLRGAPTPRIDKLVPARHRRPGGAPVAARGYVLNPER